MINFDVYRHFFFDKRKRKELFIHVVIFVSHSPELVIQPQGCSEAYG